MHGLRFALFLLTHFALTITSSTYHVLEGTGKDALKSHDEFWKLVGVQSTQSLHALEASTSDEAQQSTQSTESPLMSVSDESIVLQCKDMLSRIAVHATSPSIRFFGVIDEARGLLSTTCDKDSEKRSAFRLLCQALRLLHAPLRQLGCLILLLDTISNVSNFVPAVRFDASYRGNVASKYLNSAQSEPRRLFPPFFNFPVLRLASVPGLMQIHHALYWDHFLRGRPLWHSYFVENPSLKTSAGAVKDQLLRVLKVAQTKLMGGDANNSTYGELLASLTQESNQALVSSAACLSVCGSLVQCIEPFPSSAVASQMLSGHMVPIDLCVLFST